MAPWHWPYRIVYLAGFLVCSILLAWAWYLEPLSGLATCALCAAQVAAFAWMALCYIVGGFHSPRGAKRWAYMALVVLGALAGAAAAIQHLRLPAAQSLVCRAENCTQAAWHFLGLSMSGWALVWYVLLAAFAIHGAVHPFSPRQIARMRET